jgi:hypothetical protein
MWLGHHSPAFTLETYVHLLPDDLPEPTFLDVTTQRKTVDPAENWPKNGQRPMEPTARLVKVSFSRMRPFDSPGLVNDDYVIPELDRTSGPPGQWLDSRTGRCRRRR